MTLVEQVVPLPSRAASVALLLVLLVLVEPVRPLPGLPVLAVRLQAQQVALEVLVELRRSQAVLAELRLVLVLLVVPLVLLE